MAEITVHYYTRRDGLVCFRHAVKAAMEDREVTTETAEDVDSEYNMARTWCKLCETDPAKQE